MSVIGASARAQPQSPQRDPGERDGTRMTVHVLLFAILREQAGVDQVELELRTGATVTDALRALSELEPLGELLERLPVHLAVNRDYAALQTILSPDDELALIPPLSGGSPEPVAPGAHASRAGKDQGR